jgi:hypothetical protein
MPTLSTDMHEHFDHFFKALWNKLRRKRAQSSVLESNDSPQPKVPWDDWDLDPMFFTALSKWTLDHPDNSLDRVMGVICDRIGDSKDILKLIPSSPFPARELVMALTYLVKLGAVRRSDVFPSFMSSMAKNV